MRALLFLYINDKTKKYFKNVKKHLTYYGQYAIIKSMKGGENMKPNKKPTAFEIAELVIQAIAAIAALIAAIK